MLADGTLPDGYTVKHLRLVKVAKDHSREGVVAGTTHGRSETGTPGTGKSPKSKSRRTSPKGKGKGRGKGEGPKGKGEGEGEGAKGKGKSAKGKGKGRSEDEGRRSGNAKNRGTKRT